MRKSIFIAMIAGICLGLAPAAVLADEPGYFKFDAFGSSDMPSGSMSGVDADRWPASGPVETGAVPGDLGSDRISPNDTHYNPFYPELRSIDLGGGGQ